MIADKFKIDFGPFAQAKKNAVGFCHNLFLSNATNECAQQLVKVEQEYQEAVLRDDEELMELKKLEMQIHQSSLHLTAYIFNEADEIST